MALTIGADASNVKPVLRLHWKKILIAIAGLIGLATILFVSWVWNLNKDVEQKLKTRKFLPPTEFYTAPLTFETRGLWSPDSVRNELNARGYAESPTDRPLGPGRFWLLTGEECLKSFSQPIEHSSPTCLIFSPQETPDPYFQKDFAQLQALVWGDDLTTIQQAYQGNPLQPAEAAFLEPQLFAQYLGTIPVLQNWRPLGETPSNCLNAVLAIEDSKFLDHGGVSFLGIARAAVKNLLHGGVHQGGSTITQQMVKNFFLTSERTYKRKVTEIIMSMLLEMHANKDEIFETYLNIIYMGQSGPFEVRGFGAASRHYFGRELPQLETHQCALLAAILNSPGSFDPDRKPENALKRRNHVLDRMNELGFLDRSEAESAKTQPLPKNQRTALWETAPYYIQAALNEVRSKGFATEGMQIFTGLVPAHQAAAQKAVQNQIERLEKGNPRLQKIAERGIGLEGLLLSMDLRRAWISAAVGGRSYRRTQYNRILEGHRQVGSLMKPFVYYTALEQNKSLNALTPVQDARFNYEYEGQSWSPENYGHKYFGEVPLYFALKSSLNAATATIGLQAGLDHIVNTAQIAGAKSKLKPLPSLTLGAFELYPPEVLEMYGTLARMGSKITPVWVRAAREPEGKTLFETALSATSALDPAITAQVVGMMKQTVRTGTAAGVTAGGFTRPAAGKTGTTSDSRDAWFAGFTPDRLTVSWIGYDQKETHGLTGASGTVPIWVDFMKEAVSHDPVEDFAWPEGVKVEKIQPEQEKSEIELVMPN